jgi:hypothetical protein
MVGAQVPDGQLDEDMPYPPAPPHGSHGDVGQPDATGKQEVVGHAAIGAHTVGHGATGEQNATRYVVVGTKGAENKRDQNGRKVVVATGVTAVPQGAHAAATGATGAGAMQAVTP